MEIKNLKGEVIYTIDADTLSDADLSDANLRGANLRDADLRGAKIENVSYNEYTAFFAIVPPEEGSFIAFKKVGDYIVKLEVPADAKRSSATTRKCRCSKALVLGIYDNEKHLTSEVKVTNTKYKETDYIVGKMVEADSWDEDRWNECSHGIHFFMTFDEAKNY